MFVLGRWSLGNFVRGLVEPPGKLEKNIGTEAQGWLNLPHDIESTNQPVIYILLRGKCSFVDADI